MVMFFRLLRIRFLASSTLSAGGFDHQGRRDVDRVFHPLSLSRCFRFIQGREDSYPRIARINTDIKESPLIYANRREEML